MAGSTPVCYALYAEDHHTAIPTGSARPCVCAGSKEVPGFAGCTGSDDAVADGNGLKTCGAEGDQSCNVDWCASNLHPHFDLDIELIDELGINGADYLDHVSPVPCPTPHTLRPTAEGSPALNTCTGDETGESVCTCRHMDRVSLGQYGYVCVPRLPCNQDEATNGMSSNVHSDRCPLNIGSCQDNTCVPHTSSPDTDSWLKQHFGIEAKPELINTFPRPTVTEYCSLSSGGCGGWDVACHVPELQCDPNAAHLRKEGEPCQQEDECETKNCQWSKEGSVCGPPRDSQTCTATCDPSECSAPDGSQAADYYQIQLNTCGCSENAPAVAAGGFACCTGKAGSSCTVPPKTQTPACTCRDDEIGPLMYCSTTADPPLYPRQLQACSGPNVCCATTPPPSAAPSPCICNKTTCNYDCSSMSNERDCTLAAGAGCTWTGGSW